MLSIAAPVRSSQAGEMRKGRGGGSSVSFSKETEAEDCARKDLSPGMRSAQSRELDAGEHERGHVDGHGQPLHLAPLKA